MRSPENCQTVSKGTRAVLSRSAKYHLECKFKIAWAFESMRKSFCRDAFLQNVFNCFISIARNIELQIFTIVIDIDAVLTRLCVCSEYVTILLYSITYFENKAFHYSLVNNKNNCAQTHQRFQSSITEFKSIKQIRLTINNCIMLRNDSLGQPL